MSKLPVIVSGWQTTSSLLVDLSTDVAHDQVFSDELATIFQWIMFTFVCQIVNLFGVGSNIVNIMCFTIQGFTDPVNVSFLGLAVADLGCIITIMWTNLCLSPAFIAADLPFEPMEFQYLTGAMPHATFTRISSWITALITLERCLCIIAPIKVRSLVTPRRVTILIVLVFVVLLVNLAPFYVVNRLGYKFYTHRNKTLLGMVFVGDRETVETVSYIINNVCIPFGAFLITITCTVILVVQLRNKTKWRRKSTVSSQADHVSLRNQKVARMVVMISLLFISCFSPLCVFFIAMSLEPELSIVGKYRNAIFIFAGFGTLLESINSSANIFIYFHMSTKYRLVARQLFLSGFKPKDVGRLKCDVSLP